jgi:2-(3-amino-3-carboxypropyl)histidine synthase
MPEGLLLYATVIGDMLQRLCPCLQQVTVLGDVTYGACCVDDITAKEVGCQLLVHYGHSCLVPLQHTVVPVLYVFVEIQIHVPHLVESFTETVRDKEIPVYLLGTVQFRHALGAAKKMLDDGGYASVEIPQAKPLSPGEVLGCTSPVLLQENAIVCFVADGRFHLESAMISNPGVAAFYRYDPYSKTLTAEEYDHVAMKNLRGEAVRQAASAETFGIILGTLGRQGNPAIVKRLKQALRSKGKRHFVMLLSEVTPAKLRLFDQTIDAWVQVACPRLSVDWGHCLSNKPVLSPYELMVCLGVTEWRDVYPMDYYSQAGGPWTNYFESNRDRKLC